MITSTVEKSKTVEGNRKDSLSLGDGSAGESIMKYGETWASGLSDEQKEAVVKYTGNAYANINAKLRGIDQCFDSGNQETAFSLHETLKNTSLPVDCVVYRGASSKALGILKILPDSLLKGKIIKDYGFLSTSLDKSCAFDGDVVFEIHAPKGSHGTYVGYVSSAQHYEKEVLFDAGQKMKILDVSKDNQGRKILKVTIM